MPLYTRKTVVLAKIESLSGQYETLAGTDAVLITDATLTPVEIDSVDRDLVRPYFGSSPQLVVGQKVMLDFSCEIAGGGTTVSTKAQFDDLLQGCAFSSVNNSTHISYLPISTGFKSLSMEAYIDGVRHRLVGAMGSVEFDFPVKGRALMKYKFLGFYSTPVDTANVTPDFTGWQTPLGVNNANTTGFALHAVSGIMSALNINMNNNVIYQNLVGTGGEFVAITDRKPSGSVTVQANTMAVKNWFTTALSMTLGALTLTHGTAVANKFLVVCGNTVQILKPSYTDLEGIRMLQMGLQFIPTTAGNDEVEFRTM